MSHYEWKKHARDISFNWTWLVLNEKPENGETILFITPDMFSIDDGYIGSRMFALVQQNFAMKRKKEKNKRGETWRAIIKTGESDAVNDRTRN